VAIWESHLSFFLSLTVLKSKRAISWIWLLLAVFFAKELLWSYLIPPWQAPDELGHYGYVETLSEGRLPLLGETKIPEKVEITVNDPNLVRAYPPGEGLNYIAQHPPFYYLLLLPFYLFLSQNNPAITLLLLRIIGISLGAVTLFFAYKTVQKVAPAQKWLQMAVVCGIAFLPMFSYTAAVLNNDNLVAALAAMLIFFLVDPDQKKIQWPVTVGILLGLAALTKYTALTLVIPIVIVQLIRFFQAESREEKKKIFTNGVTIFSIAFVIAGWWYIRNYAVFKSLFPELKQAVALNPDLLIKYKYLAIFFPEIASTAQPDLTFWAFLFKQGFIVEYYRSIWGNFGKFILSQMQYIFIFILTGLSVFGFLKRLYVNGVKKFLASPQFLFFSILVSVSVTLAVKLFEIARERGFLGALNGRYFFSALIPFFYFFILGLSYLLPSSLKKHEQWFFGILIILFVVNDACAVYNVLIPNVLI